MNDISLYPDSKTYVDQPLLESQDVVFAAFARLPKLAKGSVGREELTAFIDTYFGKAGSDLENTTAEDFQEQPPNFLPLVKNETILKWGGEVNQLWNYLSRLENASVVEDPEKHSLLTLPYPAVVAGDRFREVYYWDSYFIVRGLIVSGMTQTAMNVVENLAFLLKEHGLVPNGARTYYLNRSQPPLLSAMVRVVYEATNDTVFLADQYDALKTEHAFWTRAPIQVTIQSGGRSYNLSRYWSTLESPRPESYKEDMATAAGLSEVDQKALWHNLASGAASGWDFSSRWFKDGRNLSTCQTSLHLPTDLNAFLYQMEQNMADFADLLGESEEASRFQAAAGARKEAINSLLWNQTSGQWHDLVIAAISPDYQVSAFTPQSRTYASNWVPLWAGVADPRSSQAVAACNSLATSGLIQAGGVLTSLYNTSQQWDAPNAWPPLQYFVVEGLQSHGDAAAQKLASQVAQTWLESNYKGYLQNGGKMVEKYDGVTPGVEGGGGEYDVQTGFGWTNGVMLHFLQKYGWEPANSLAGSGTLVEVDVNAFP